MEKSFLQVMNHGYTKIYLELASIIRRFIDGKAMLSGQNHEMIFVGLTSLRKRNLCYINILKENLKFIAFTHVEIELYFVYLKK